MNVQCVDTFSDHFAVLEIKTNMFSVPIGAALTALKFERHYSTTIGGGDLFDTVQLLLAALKSDARSNLEAVYNQSIARPNVFDFII